jgi:predicted nucleotidyltransferase
MTNIEMDRFKANFDKELILLCESGSKTYGFKSERSDTDIRAVFVENTASLLSLRPPKDTIQGFSQDRMGDWQIFELKKFLGLLIKPNFNVMEWIYTPYQHMKFPKELKTIAALSISQDLGKHARGWSYSIYKMDWSDPKKCIYALRPLMVYINLCETGKFESNITKLSDRFNITDHIDLLISLYRTNHKASDVVRAKTLNLYDELVATSEIIEKDSWLPIKPPQRAFDMANEFLIKVRNNQSLI